MAEMSYTYKILVRKSKWGDLGVDRRTVLKWISRIGIRGCGLGWTCSYRAQSRSFVTAVKKLCVPQIAWYLVTSCATMRLSVSQEGLCFMELVLVSKSVSGQKFQWYFKRLISRIITEFVW